MDNYDWNEIDEEAAREGKALKGAFKRSRIKDGTSKVPLKEQSHDYRNVDASDLLALNNVIDGKMGG